MFHVVNEGRHEIRGRNYTALNGALDHGTRLLRRTLHSERVHRKTSTERDSEVCEFSASLWLSIGQVEEQWDLAGFKQQHSPKLLV
jgi:hypothetical protein